jgi:hypothetical protein
MGIIAQPMYYGNGPQFWINRGPLYSFSYCWWPSVFHPTARGGEFHGLGPALGYKYVFNFKPEFWAWSSNRYSMGWILDDAYPVDPWGNIIYVWPALGFTYEFDPVDGFNILRIWNNVFAGIVEVIAPLPPRDPSYWLKSSGRAVSLPQQRPYPR